MMKKTRLYYFSCKILAHSLSFFAGSGLLIYTNCYHQPGITGFLAGTASRDIITKLQ